MRAQLITLDLVGLALHGLYKLACVAILYFLADAVFYHGDWRSIAYAGFEACMMYYVSRSYDKAFAGFARKREEEPRQQEFKFAVHTKRRMIVRDSAALWAVDKCN